MEECIDTISKYYSAVHSILITQLGINKLVRDMNLSRVKLAQ